MVELKLNRILLFDNIREDHLIKLADKLIKTIDASAQKEQAIDLYYQIERELLKETQDDEVVGTYWENYICRLLAESENPFSLMCEKGNPRERDLELALRDLQHIKRIFHLDWERIAKEVIGETYCVCNFTNGVNTMTRRQEVKAAMMLEDDKATALKLADYYKAHACGLQERYAAFMWNGDFVGVSRYDGITFDDLFGYELQWQQMIHNTQVFLEGRRANNVLLYGDKGTGKSSGVKAVLNMFKEQGLRMINIPKDRIFDINQIMEKVSDRGCKYILFIDDLSFEETESQYKYFKSVLEGGIETQPENVLVYVTSNRRNLVKETWKDRSGDSAEVHVVDGIQERLSLADRFGLTITFTAPDKKLYFEIVTRMAEKEGLNVSGETLIAEANRWDMRQTSRSGRSAKQFITYLSGQI